MAANLRLQRVVVGVQKSTANLQLQRVVVGVQAPTANLRLQRVVVGTQVSVANLRLRRVVVGTALPSTFDLTATASVTSPVGTNVTVTLNAVPTLPSGDSVATWAWKAVSANSPALSDPTVQSPTFTTNPEIIARNLIYQVTVRTTLGLVSTAQVAVPVLGSAAFRIDVDGTLKPVTYIGRSPKKTPPKPPPPPSPHLRLRRVVVGLQGVDTGPPPTGPGTATMLVGGTARYPQVPTPTTRAQDYVQGCADFGKLQASKDYWSSNTLSARYVPSYPSDVITFLSITKDCSLTTNFSSFMSSLPSTTVLIFQHEPERPTVYSTGSAFVADFNNFRRLVRAVRTDIPVWYIASGYQYRSGNPGYDGSFFSGTDASGNAYKIQADGYGLDTYRDGTNNNVNGGLVNDITVRAEFLRWKSFVPKGASWGITETGFGRVNETGLVSNVVALRQQACSDTFASLTKMGAYCFMPFFSDEGPDGHNWRPEVSGPNAEPGFQSMYQGLARAGS